MSKNLKDIEKAVPGFAGEGRSLPERVRELEKCVMALRHALVFTLNNLSIENFNKAGLTELLQVAGLRVDAGGNVTLGAEGAAVHLEGDVYINGTLQEGGGT